MDPVHSAIKNTETSGVYCMNPHKELIIHIKDTVIQYPYIVPVSSHIPTYVPSMIPNIERAYNVYVHHCGKIYSK